MCSSEFEEKSISKKKKLHLVLFRIKKSYFEEKKLDLVLLSPGFSEALLLIELHSLDLIWSDTKQKLENHPKIKTEARRKIIQATKIEAGKSSKDKNRRNSNLVNFVLFATAGSGP